MHTFSSQLVQKLRRTYFKARLWLSSTEQHPPEDLPEEFGWKLQDGSYKINWFAGDTTPSMLDVAMSEEQMEIEGKNLLLPFNIFHKRVSFCNGFYQLDSFFLICFKKFPSC